MYRMRRLHKGPAPDILRTTGTTMTAAYVAARNAGVEAGTPWRHAEIVAALGRETREKCAYCEAIVRDVAPTHVEHILPKSRRPDLVVDWTNLTVACPVCNSNKGDYYSGSAPLLNPYAHEPTAHIQLRGPLALPHVGDELGRRTVEKLKLSRAELILERAKRIEALHDRIERWSGASDPDEKSIFAETIEEMISDEAEFATTLRQYAVDQGFPVTPPDPCDQNAGC